MIQQTSIATFLQGIPHDAWFWTLEALLCRRWLESWLLGFHLHLFRFQNRIFIIIEDQPSSSGEYFFKWYLPLDCLHQVQQLIRFLNGHHPGRYDHGLSRTIATSHFLSLYCSIILLFFPPPPPLILCEQKVSNGVPHWNTILIIRKLRRNEKCWLENVSKSQ